MAGLIVPSEKFKEQQKQEQAQKDQKKTRTNANTRLQDRDIVVADAEPTPEQQDALSLSNYLNQVNSYSANEIEALYRKLKAAGYYKGQILDTYTYDLQDAIIRAEKEIAALKPIKGAIDRETYYAEQAARGGVGDAGTAFVSDPTEAAGYVRSVFKSTLQRDPTADEITKYTDILNKAQKKSLRKTVNGITTGGLGNPTEFLIQEVQKLPEFSTKKKEKDTLTTQSLQSVARANGITLSADQLSAYITDINNGKDINVIKNNIRNSAGLGMPDNIKKMLADGTDLETVYAPYKSTMASLLEIPATDISLDDSILRSAIGPDKEMPIYEFRKALKKDPRWQYTNNARAEVSDKVLRVLQDFGFQA